jgi:hypothetical protein
VADEASRQTTTEAIEECPTDRAHTATIEMMNVHKYSALNSYMTAPRSGSPWLASFRYQTVSANCAISTLTILGKQPCDRVFPTKYRCCVFEITFLEFRRSRLGSEPRLLACSRGSRLHEIVLIIKNFDPGDRYS